MPTIMLKLTDEQFADLKHQIEGCDAVKQVEAKIAVMAEASLQAKAAHRANVRPPYEALSRKGVRLLLLQTLYELGRGSWNAEVKALMRVKLRPKVVTGTRNRENWWSRIEVIVTGLRSEGLVEHWRLTLAGTNYVDDLLQTAQGEMRQYGIDYDPAWLALDHEYGITYDPAWYYSIRPVNAV